MLLICKLFQQLSGDPYKTQTVSIFDTNMNFIAITHYLLLVVAAPVEYLTSTSEVPDHLLVQGAPVEYLTSEVPKNLQGQTGKEFVTRVMY